MLMLVSYVDTDVWSWCRYRICNSILDVKFSCWIWDLIFGVGVIVAYAYRYLMLVLVSYVGTDI